MTLTAFWLIMFSAMFHALWNLLAKKYHMTLPFYAIICLSSALIWLHVQFWTPVPIWNMPLQFWLYLAGSVISDACLYAAGLLMSYRLMDMSSAYPMMRSLPLILTAVITMIFGIGKPLTYFAVAGMLLVFSGCIFIPMKNFRDFNWRNYCGKNMFFIFLTACGTTGYTVFDSLSLSVMRDVLADMNVSKTIISISYYSTRGIFLSSSLVAGSLLLPVQRKHLKEIWTNYRFIPFVAGGFASLTYALVLISMNFVDNIFYIPVFRQIGLLTGLFAGIFILKEKGTLPKYIGSLLIVCGLVLSVVK